ncbi:hypothetical protein L207DRAFT_99427 [Hyaloscypha variabilis F]|uniref:Uncharacterized protein n=1 Tax=Hyaloscypha variabilis (strain UAMH 11265 / GT02V1 / F) TaxID=1149755 RepID=A0A2J6RBY8_HYAVF|nr:hypothetical protein L207DRAFT_99427 [Hyaloscypha variabilis F]
MSLKLPTITKMPNLSTSYLLPAVLLNPAFILHLINTYVSHMSPPPLTISHSPHPIMESLGPLPGSEPYLDMHADDKLCWRYTIVMVIVQLFSFIRVSDNRVRRRSAREAAKLERERIRKEKSEQIEQMKLHAVSQVSGIGSYLDGSCDFPEKPYIIGTTHRDENGIVEIGKPDERTIESSSDESLTETSEEEMII